MHKQFETLSTLIFIGFLMAACGNSGSGTPGGGGGSSSAAHLFYKSGSISRIDPDKPTATPILVEGGNTSWETGIIHGTLDTTNKRITGLHIQSIVYANTDNGKLYKISTLKRNSQTPVQVSNETGAFAICITDNESDWSDHGKSVFFYRLPGGDNTCFTGDDLKKMVRLNMSASDTPIVANVARNWKLGLFNQSTGALEGFLAVDGNTFERCDQNLQNCTHVISFSRSAEELERNFSGDVILRIDAQIFHYDTVSGVLSPPRHTFSSGAQSSVNSAADETTMFFADGDQIFKLPMNGSASSTPFVTESGKTLLDITLTTNKVVYIAITSGSSTLAAVHKISGASTALIPSTTDNLLLFTFTSGDFIYYKRSPFIGGPIRGVIKEDGTSGSEIPNAKWSGYQSSIFSFGGIVIDRMIWAEGCVSFDDCRGGTLKSVDATNNAELNLGAIPLDTVFITSSNLGGGSNQLGRGWISNTGTDIFFVNPNQENSLIRITDTPGFDERHITY